VADGRGGERARGRGLSAAVGGGSVTKSEDKRNVDRRVFLQRVACAGTGAMWTLARGVLKGMPTAQATAGGTQVIVDNFSFTPATTAVPVGATVTWTNHDDVPHNVVSTEKKFASPVLDTDEKFSYKFEAAGTFKYYCSIHPRMTGQVVVG
jgi:plastocyanin